MLILVCGLDHGELVHVVATIAAGRHPDLEPIIVTDCSDFRLFREHDLLFEYLPPPAQQQRHAPTKPWDLYVTRRLTRLRRKWAPVRMSAFGAASRALLDRQRQAAIEDEDVTLLIG